MRVIVAGTRSFTDYNFLKEKLDTLFQGTKPTAIVCGMANGADMMGRKYAKENNIPAKEMKANWDKYGRSAGYIRNREMALEADALVCFWDGESRGSKNMIDIARGLGLKVRVVSVPRSVEDSSSC